MKPRIRTMVVAGGALALMVSVSATAAQYAPEWVPGDVIVRAGASWAEPQGDGGKHHDGVSNIYPDGDDVQFSADITWLFAEHWGLELFGTSPFKFDLYRKNGEGKSSFGELEYSPVTLSLQYHFNPYGTFRPYVGVLAAYGIVMGDKPAKDYGGDIDFDSDFGFGGGAGIDIGPAESAWFFNLAVKYIDQDLDADFCSGKNSTFQLDPLIYTAAVGLRFGQAPAPEPAAAPPPPPPPPPVLVEGHTDSIGSDAYNMGLSDRRAKAVFDYLSSRGVDPARMSSVGYGETRPIADNATDEGRQQNRRVMLIRTDTGM
jgi:outer membrane protein W